ncbi:uracil phosphoribosyltransferase [Flavihumibacter rivuli]|uniref:uracil phosphoribosyltransferase n=1 Tax=Flavihumibacter rivuli TaxID=2838156 RepID=UPI001BDDDBD4|nr:uracil phosphoribosyltransferase [Flavihumibacter rivuli]ULQ54930.1 uracil phosphoribosyltransferase [Flavihumibacter rivuli]
MVVNLSKNYSLLCDWVRELRDVNIQQDRMRFRRNLERIGEVAALEISKHMAHHVEEVPTPMGSSNCKVLSQQPVLATILRAGMPLHQGLLNYFDKADNAFISAYRKHHPDGSFEISMEYVSCPELDGRVLIIADPMLATGASLVKTIQHLRDEGAPKEVHIVCAIACTVGIEYLHRNEPNVKIWCGAIDEELTAKSYIVPGLGDAGDLAFGPKMQS